LCALHEALEWHTPCAGLHVIELDDGLEHGVDHQEHDHGEVDVDGHLHHVEPRLLAREES
jgi:hypothetical protein